MTIKKLRNKILDLAIHGKLVKQDANDEPASTLLARIRQEKEQLVKDGKLKKKDLVTTPVSDEDKPFEVPEGWEWCRLSTLVSSDCTLGYGIVQPMDDIPNGVPLVRPVDLVKPIIGKDGLKRVDQSISETYKRTILKGGEILFCVRASVGKVSIASPELCGANVTRGISPIWFDYEILTRYVFYLFQSNTSIKEIKEYAKGATLQQINVEDLKKLLIPLPPLAEQQRIVAAVEQLMSLVDIIESGKENLQQSIALAKNKILDLAIKGKLVEKEGEWEEKTLGEVCKIKGGKRIPKGKSFSDEPTNHAYIRVTNMKNHTIVSHDIKYIDDSVYELIKNYTISANDLYLTIAGTIGDVGEVPEEYDMMNLTENAAKLTDITCDKKYLMYCLLSTPSQDHFSSKFHQVAQPKLSIETAKTTSIPLPPLSEQQRIVSKIEELFTQLNMIEKMLF